MGRRSRRGKIGSEDALPHLPHVVRYPRSKFLTPSIFFAIAVYGFVNTVNGTGRWTFLEVALFALFGCFSLVYLLMSQTVFSSDEVTQRNGIGRIVNYRYSDILKVELGGRDGNALFLSTSDGRRINVYGAASQLIAARQILLRRLPQFFAEYSATHPWWR